MKPTTSQLRNSFNEKPGGLRKEQQQEQHTANFGK